LKNKRKLYLKQLNSLHEIYLGIKILHCCVILPEEHFYKDNYLHFAHQETQMLLLGRVWILLADEYRGKDRKSHNSISLKVLINEIIDDKSISAKRYRGKGCVSKKDLSGVLKEIKILSQVETDEGYPKYDYFRNKINAHIDLNDDGSRKKINQLRIFQRDLTALFTLSEKAFDNIFLYLDCASSDHMEHHINTLKDKILNSFEKAGLIEKNNR